MKDPFVRNETKPLISVIIPAYNAKKTICETMDSVFSQTYPNLQILVVNDASRDGTLEKLKQYDDPRLEIIDLPLTCFPRFSAGNSVTEIPAQRKSWPVKSCSCWSVHTAERSRS